MLGRLLRTNSFIDLLGSFPNGKDDGKGPQPHHEATPPPSSMHMPDELRTLLYGCRKVEGEGRGGEGRGSGTFRLVVAQELGQMMSRDNYQVVLDCGGTRAAVGSGGAEMPLSELKEYIFGSPVRLSDRCRSDKLKLSRGARVIVVTRIFYTGYAGNARRLAVCCCIPEQFLTVVTECWSQVSAWFDEVQDVLMPLLEAEPLLPKDLRVSAPAQVDVLLHKFYRHLILPLHGLLETHRLFLYPADSLDFVTAWFREVFNWLEVKDGHRLKFLPALLGKLRHDAAAELLHNRSSRIVVMSGNVTVANKLIFILSAFLRPRYSGQVHYVDDGLAARNVELKEAPADPKYSSTITSKGWEIPRKRSRSSVLSKSSDETSFAHVFLPSSLRSTNSLQYISSSLNSQYGSYGSWFKKTIPLGHSPRINESPDNTFMHHHTNSTSSLQQQQAGTCASGNNASSVTTSTTPNTNRWSQGSPSISEYEEYPWLGYGTAPSGAPSKSRIQKVNMPRNSNRVHDKKLLHERFVSICGDVQEVDFHTSPATESYGAILEVPILEELSFPSQELLPRYSSYLPTLDPAFQVQACPITSNTERRLVDCMKQDLHNAEYSRTLLISLRSREIKEITITKDPSTKTIVQRTKKIFLNGKPGHVSQKLHEEIHFVDNHLTATWKKWEDPVESEDKTKLFITSFHELMK
ncbi:AEL127Cp [Eremothecium gossypii ATCC 10895]|uniref:Protein LST4 n=1 Tax=Eremothecium gossypii (strain ATCC 10895 / CBS 109.51 / FGSC 9923 / NRRL Y-1056) TaxID=284811 RepID=LST4_EREGS|nr:AEL127Cp [Eremothecium gossypii ATCC 10895]Q757Y7.2 RecName: Full=Protein LST4 [Eremothecium gossypii ATCC 10895]AAS52558.2 AEL127Cp [Eremothecium gossypii ATCC 10895]AEY96859.1 FAEL127Cp [Eremothecium gossypii FDAG1]